MSTPWPLPPEAFPDHRGRLDERVAERLLARRQLLLLGPLDTEQATRLAARLMTLEADGSEPITLSVNSTGGDLPALFSVTDTVQAMHAPVDTRCLGQARGSAAALVACGTGRRQAAPHAQFVLELPRSEASGAAADVQRSAEEQGQLSQQLFALLADATGRSKGDLAEEWQRGRVLSAQQAADAGLVDEVAG